ncbi:hypothetical protein V7S43_004792 [Phytophthora oleae]|uniref:AGC-kinase C-terminal domain-containing protein n=1 Tax=Phytophthora oleae TaxID=2107226 RepID=A0ABD3FU92_9STRA
MFQVAPPSFPPQESEIERFRARHRRLCRDQQKSVATSKIENLDQDEGRTRKISSNWPQKHRQVSSLQYEDGFWPGSAGTEMRLAFNAFDFSASPEAFNDEPDELVEITA